MPESLRIRRDQIRQTLEAAAAGTQQQPIDALRQMQREWNSYADVGLTAADESVQVRFTSLIPDAGIVLRKMDDLLASGERISKTAVDALQIAFRDCRPRPNPRGPVAHRYSSLMQKLRAQQQKK